MSPCLPQLRDDTKEAHALVRAYLVAQLPTGELRPAALRSCQLLQTLNMDSLENDDGFQMRLVFLSAALVDCFGWMPQLQYLTIRGAQLGSLAFLRVDYPAGPRHSTCATSCHALPSSELEHVLALGALRSLYVGFVLSSPADEAVDAHVPDTATALS